jgi:hypothetical protein
MSPSLREPPAGLAAAAAFGCLLEDAEQGALADWTLDLATFVRRVAALDPTRGPMDLLSLVRDAESLLKAGGLRDGHDVP